MARNFCLEKPTLVTCKILGLLVNTLATDEKCPVLSRQCFEKQYGKRAKALLNSASQHLYPIYGSLLSQLSWKKSLFLTCKILGVVVNTLAANENYPVLNRENLTLPIQMQLSQKLKTFSQFFPAFFKSSWNFEYFERKHDSHRFGFFEVTYSENDVR